MQSGDDSRFTPTPSERPIPTPSERPVYREARSSRRSRVRLAGVLVIALIVGLIAWLVVEKSDDSSQKSNPTKAVVSAQGLQKRVTTLGVPVFWAGPEQGARYGVEQRSNGQVYVRYVTSQMKTDTVATLTVGTYPMKNAYS